MAKVLIIDDDALLRVTMSELVGKLGHETTFASTLAEGRRQALSGEFDAVFLDVRLPDGNGLDLLPQLSALELPPEVIVMTGAAPFEGPEIAVRHGVFDYLQKPLSPKAILQPLTELLRYRDNLREAVVPQTPIIRCGIIGQSQPMLRTLDKLAVAARGTANVLLTGETGTGKELLARALHANSPRAQKPYVVFDCTAVPASLMESTLFGYAKGAFTGADKAHEGLVRMAHGGTLFLDEIGELPLELQKKLLRVLQERRFRPVGDEQEVTSDFHLVSATNRDLESMVDAGLFRQDLLYRIGAVVIRVPALRERMDDLELLVEALTKRICERNAIPAKLPASDLLRLLRAYHWPGNIRELANILEAAILNAFYEPALFAKHLPELFRLRLLQENTVPGDLPCRPATRSPAQPGPGSGEERIDLAAVLDTTEDFLFYKEFKRMVMEHADRFYFDRLMQHTQGQMDTACALSGLGKSRLYALLKNLDIDKN